MRSHVKTHLVRLARTLLLTTGALMATSSASATPTLNVHLITTVVPADGALVIDPSWADAAGLHISVLNSQGQEVPGTYQKRDRYGVWSPEERWVVGESYTFVSYNDNFGDTREPFTVSAPLNGVVPDLSLTLSIEPYADHNSELCCDTGAPSPKPPCFDVEEALGTMWVAAPVAPIDDVVAAQYLLGYQLDGAPSGVLEPGTSQPAQRFLATAREMPLPGEQCVQRLGLNLRTGEEIRGPRACAHVALEKTDRQKTLTHLGVEECPYPPYYDVAKWCSFNAAHCERANCPTYQQACSPNDKMGDAGGRDDATPQAAQRDSADVGSSGCSLTPHTPRSFGPPAFALLVLGLFTRRRVRS